MTALVWKPLKARRQNIGAVTPFGTYYVETFGKRDPFWVEFRNIGFDSRVAFDTQEEAKAFAETDFEARLSASQAGIGAGVAIADAMVMAGAKEASLWAGASGVVWEEHEALARRVLTAALTAGVVKAEPVAVTDEMVERFKAAFIENTGATMWPTDGQFRSILTAALASKPEGER